jgi:hypothetical protein
MPMIVIAVVKRRDTELRTIYFKGNCMINYDRRSLIAAARSGV